MSVPFIGVRFSKPERFIIKALYGYAY